jgi:hypothetical protein
MALSLLTGTFTMKPISILILAMVSQGSHFFHNMSNLGVLYFSIKKHDLCPIDWKWLGEQKVINERKYIRHIRLKSPLAVKVDGRKRIGVICK